jgi:hypothetical protein
VFDLPHLRGEAEATIAAAGLGDRCSFEGGSFFEEVPGGADVYILSQILHDWNDDVAVSILDTVAEAMRPDSRLLLVEVVLGPGDGADWGKLLDLFMLVLLAGRERTEDEWRAVLGRGGFTLVDVDPAAFVVHATRG